jgi:hypothetical protein
MKIRFTGKGIEITPKPKEPTVIERAKTSRKEQEERVKSAMSPAEVKRKVKTTEKKRMYRKDFATEQEYMTALNKALGNYAKWLKANGKLK